MELLIESLLDVLVFRCSATNSRYIWTCLALAAGIGIWHFRSLGSIFRLALAPHSRSNSSAISPMIPQQPPLRPTSAPISSAMMGLDIDESRDIRSPTKGRLTTYFFMENEIYDCDKGDEYHLENDGVCSCGEYFDMLDWGWRGDLGWYCCQDLKVINGSVVKVWNASAEMAQHRRRRRSCGGSKVDCDFFG